MTSLIMNTSESDLDNEHSHCQKCCLIKCKFKGHQGNKCPIILCRLNCGSRFHSCKEPEHQELCSRRKVPCINSQYGCPVILHRYQIGSHLEHCPASSVICMMEWNRWPVYSKERQSRVPFSQKNLYARYGQLDVSLALRDQRVLNDAWRAPSSIRRVLRNHLTKRFPAVPLTANEAAGAADDVAGHSASAETSHTVSDDEAYSDAPWETSKDPPGLQSSILNELFKATKTTADRLTNALSLVTDGDIEHVKSNNIDLPLVNIHSKQNQMVVNGEDINTEDFCAADILFSCDKTNQSNSEHMETKPTCNCDENHSVVSSFLEPPAERPPLTLQEILALDLNLESITRYQPKPVAMYTFLCAQLFRRDEYCSHFKNVHGDIHGGLNGWLEYRCPLAQYGCTYSAQRFYPERENAHVVYNKTLESFGIATNSSIDNGQVPATVKQSEDSAKPANIAENFSKESTPEIFTSKNYDCVVNINGRYERLHEREHQASPLRDVDRLSSLPFEILEHIGQYLDSFSLSILSLTSKRLRDVCASLLPRRGLITLKWKKELLNDRETWRISHQVWRYSSCFSTVNRWGFTDRKHLSEHLTKCRFFERALLPENSVRLPGMSCDVLGNPSFLEPIKRMYPNQDFSHIDLVMTSLHDSHENLDSIRTVDYQDNGACLEMID